MSAPMPYRRLGRSGLLVSPICLGSMMFGGRADESESRTILARAREAGVNFVDTANTYTGGRSEEIVGRAIRNERDYWVLATKLANPAFDHPNGGGLSRRHILEAVPHSLKRLGTDHIDILYLHKDDPAVPPETTVRAMADLIRAGKIRHFGVSNFAVWRIAAFCAVCDAEGIDRPAVSQPIYHAFKRQVEIEHLPACDHFGLGVFCYSPLGRGLLTGKYRPDNPPDPDSRAGRADKRLMESEFSEETVRLAARFADHAKGKGVSPSAFAIAWTLRNPLVTGVIAGPRTLSQFESYLEALSVNIEPADEAAIDALVPPGHAAGGIFVDPRYPVTGRPVAARGAP